MLDTSAGDSAARIAIQGEAGSFSHEAALRMFPQACILPCPLSADVFARLADGSATAAVIPIENSLAGSVVEHYDLLFSNPVHIARESLLRIRHTLIAPAGLKLENVRRVYSHPVALAQCCNFFAQRPAIEAVPFYDTAGSVKHVSALGSQAASAAIASREAARVYGAAVLRENLEDNPENYTRFFLVRPGPVEPGTQLGLVRPAPGQPPPASTTKVSVAFSVRNQPGTLVAALQVFAGYGTNLTRLESRPIPGQPWHYIFYADYELPWASNPVDASAADGALERLGEHCLVVKELGRYAPASLHAE